MHTEEFPSLVYHRVLPSVTMILEHPLRDDERAFLDSVAELARTEVMPYADQWDHDENLPREIFTKAGELGMMGMAAPKEYGGRGMSYVTVALAIKELGNAYAALAMDIAAHNALAVGQINQFGTEEQKKKYLPRLTSGEWIGAWALTEPNAGSDTGGIETKASQDGDVWRVNGLKKFITSGRTAELLVVMATTGKTDAGKNEISAFIMMKDQVTPLRKIQPTECARATRRRWASKIRKRKCSAVAVVDARRPCRFWTAAASASPRLRLALPRLLSIVRTRMRSSENNSDIPSAIFKRCNGCSSIPRWNSKPPK